MPVPALAHPRGELPREDASGASRLTRSARVSSSGEKLSNASRAWQAGVRHQAVDLAGVGRQPLRGSLLGEVGRSDPVLARQRLGQLSQRLGLARAEHERGAALGECAGNRPPEAAGGPGEENPLARELHVHEANGYAARRP